MINNPKLIEEIKEKIKLLSKEDLEKVMKEVDEWYDSELNKCIDRFDRKEVENGNNSSCSN